MTCGEIIAQIEKDYPTSCALEWDNVGLLADRAGRHGFGDPGGGG